MEIYFTMQNGMCLKYVYLDYTLEDAVKVVEHLTEMYGEGQAEIYECKVH